MRPRGKDKHLPPCVYHRHGAYWYVKRGSWTRLGESLTSSLAKYASIVSPSKGACDELLDRSLVKCKIKPRTRIQYALACRRLKIHLAEFTPEQVEPHHIAGIVDHYNTSPNAANRILTFARIAFSNGLTWGLCRFNPTHGVKRLEEGKRTRLLLGNEFKAIWSSAPAQLRAIMDVKYQTGQRIGDILKIRLSDISKDGIEFEQEKTGKRLKVSMTPELEEAIQRAKSLHSNIRGLTLFHGRGGKPLSYKGVYDAFKRACKRAEVEDATPHDIRAKAATDAENQGKDPSKLLGHSSRQTTIRYLRDRGFKLVEGPSIGQSLENWTEDSKKSKA